MRDLFTFAVRLCFRECGTMNKCTEGKNCDHRPISIKYKKKKGCSKTAPEFCNALRGK